METKTEIMRLRAVVNSLRADLAECREYIEQAADVVDGDDGQPKPNKAMRLVTMIDEALG